jgi:hypothetical protein
MQRLLISYDLLEPKRTRADLRTLYAKLNSLGAVQIQESVWAIRTEMSVAHLLMELQGYFGPIDRLLISHSVETMNRRGINKLPRL